MCHMTAESRSTHKKLFVPLGVSWTRLYMGSVFRYFMSINSIIGPKVA